MAAVVSVTFKSLWLARACAHEYVQACVHVAKGKSCY